MAVVGFIMHTIGSILIVAGVVLTAIASIGLLRFPDFYARTHVAGKPDTLGGILLLSGLAIHMGFNLDAFKILLILVFFALTNPAASHLLARAAMKSGLKPWNKKEDA